MKFGASFSKYLGICVAVAAGLLVTSVQASVSKATVRAVRGSATVTSDKGATWKPVRVGQTISPMSTIKTAPESTVDLFLDQNGPVLRVTADTSISIEKLDYENTGVETVIDTQLDLRSGRILGNVKKMAAASKYEVKTPTGVAGIRGTEYDISANGTVHVKSGTVVVVYVLPGGQIQTVTVGPGMTATPPNGNTPASVGPTPPGYEFPPLTVVIPTPEGQPNLPVITIPINPDNSNSPTKPAGPVNPPPTGGGE